MSTLPDPRSRTMSTANERPSTPLQHPDLSNEVATLSNKLINAINHQTNLDDTLSATRHELETSRERCRQLEEQNREHTERVAKGVLIEKTKTETEKNKLMLDLAEERKLRRETEKAKKDIELELESLTTALFEEANKVCVNDPSLAATTNSVQMVITAREDAQKEHETITKKNDQLKTQLADMESLLKSQQEQLTELKQVMEQMTVERDDQTNATAPSTPGLSKFDSKDELQDSYAVQATPMSEPISPSYPTSFTHLLSTVLRTDLTAYDDFTSLLKMSKNVAGSRASSGSYGSIGLGLGLGAYAGTAPPATNGSTTSLATSATLGSSPATPTTPASTISTGSINGPNSLTPLKETKFYKRALAEDIEPTLRLDTAPGLSWLARRTVQNAICDGTLVVDPMPASTKPYLFACSLCGETRKDSAHVRSHRFRTNENDSAQRYPLCKYCLGRIRSTCDFLGFLRILKDGHWRADDEESEKAAWEESVRLREQMFWSRMGGGVVPAAHHHHADLFKSPRVSEDARKEQQRNLSEELERSGELKPKDITPLPGKPTSAVTGPGKDTGEIAETSEHVEQIDFASSSPAKVTSIEVELPEKESDAPTTSETTQEQQNTNRASTISAASSKIGSPGDGEVQRLSITIPGSFDQ